MLKITYGNGLIRTQQANNAEGNKCLVITKEKQAREIGSHPEEWDKTKIESEIDLMLEFKSIAAARVLQDELGEMIAIWSRESGPSFPKE